MTDVINKNNVKALGAKDKQAILFVHGYGCDQNMWRFMVPAFKDDYRVVLMDMTGFGASDLSSFHTSKYPSLHAYAQEVIAVCESLTLQDVVLVGHSVGATICMLAVIARPELFSKIVMIGPSPYYINEEDYVGGFEKEDIDELLDVLDNNYLGWSSTMAPVIMGNPDRPALAEELTNSFCRTDPNIAKHFARLTFLSDHREDLKKVSIPCLILQCAEDAIAPKVVGQYVNTEIAGSKLIMMQAKGHCPNLSAPEETTSYIQAFLAES